MLCFYDRGKILAAHANTVGRLHAVKRLRENKIFGVFLQECRPFNNQSILYINKFSKYEKEDALFNGINCPASIALIGIHQGNSMQGTYCRQ